MQSFKYEKEYKLLKEYLSTQSFYHLKDPNKSYSEAANIRIKCNKKVVTINSTIDFLIVQTAIENKFILLHNDKYFNLIKKIVSIKIY